MPIKTFIPQFLSTLTLISDIALGLLLIFFIYKHGFKKTKLGFLDNIWKFATKNALLFAFIVALTATLGSLFYSEILGFEPCKLCWLQRKFMYPMVILFGVALIKNDYDIADYAIPLSVIGSFIALYHYVIQRTNYAVTCGINSTVPCTIKYIFAYGYITIPMMALTAFIMIIILMYFWKKGKNS